MEDGGGLRRDGVGDFPGLAVAHPCAAEAIRDADLYEADSSGAHRMIVEIALAARDDHLVLHPRRVGQPVHLAGVETGDAGGGAEHQPRRGARGDQPRLRSRRLGDRAARRGLQLGDIDAMT